MGDERVTQGATGYVVSTRGLGARQISALRFYGPVSLLLKRPANAATTTPTPAVRSPRTFVVVQVRQMLQQAGATGAMSPIRLVTGTIRAETRWSIFASVHLAPRFKNESKDRRAGDLTPENGSARVIRRIRTCDRVYPGRWASAAVSRVRGRA